MSKRFLDAMFEARLPIKWTGETGRVVPPLVAGDSHIDEIAGNLRDVVGSLGKGGSEPGSQDGDRPETF
jgi:adenosylmethionine-8-amino-7-oxononanoate aminotransferase